MLGTVFPVGFRAAEASRVLRLDPHDYHAVAAVAPAVSREVGRLAGNRMTGARGLQGIAADPPPPRATVVGHRWDAACAELRHFLDRNQVTFTWVQPEEPDAAERWDGTLPRDGDLPVVRARRRQDGGAAAAAARGRAARARDGTGRGGVRHGRRRRRPRRPRRRRVRRVGRPADARGGARGARRPGRVVVPHRELPRLPGGRVRRRAREPRAAAGPAARRRDPRHPDDRADRPGDAGGAPRRRRRPADADDHPRLRASPGGAWTSKAATGCSARASRTAPHAARRRPPTGWTSTSSAPGTRPARRRCSSPRTRAA